MSEDTQELVRLCREQIQAGSKSFSFASFFLNRKERHGAWLLYSWCRFCDDEIDRAHDREAALRALDFLEEETRAALGLVPSPIECSRLLPFEGLKLVARSFAIPPAYPLDLLRGMRMDVEGRVFETPEELEEYCYCVAGVVGLMMCHITGVSDPRALSHAVALGNAMQMTNIARDIDQDWQLGRIYFPRQWLREVWIRPEEFGSPENVQKWPLLAKRLLTRAETSYQNGEAGLRYLSFRSSVAIAIAARIYREIGYEVESRGAEAWKARRYVTGFRKVTLALTTGSRMIWRLFPRILHGWRAHPLGSTPYSFTSNFSRSR